MRLRTSDKLYVDIDHVYYTVTNDSVVYHLLTTNTAVYNDY